MKKVEEMDERMREKTEYVLITENLVKKFSDYTAVSNLSISVSRGEIFGFLGPNGAGKTTSINMISGLLKADSGKIFINGREAGSHSEIRRDIGVCPQEIILWKKLTCKEQLVFMGEMYGLKNRDAKERAEKLLADLGLSEKKDKLASQLSGGMQRRLNLLLALMHRPSILILDEPEAGLDPQSRILVRDYIKSLAGTTTIILTTHNMDEADRLCNRIAIIDKGKLLVTDTKENLKKSTGTKDILEIEFAKPVENSGLTGVLDNMQLSPVVLNNHLVLKGFSIIEKLPEILGVIKSNNIEIGEIKLRENTLEDVFISLTGKRLRDN